MVRGNNKDVWGSIVKSPSKMQKKVPNKIKGSHKGRTQSSPHFGM